MQVFELLCWDVVGEANPIGLLSGFFIHHDGLHVQNQQAAHGSPSL